METKRIKTFRTRLSKKSYEDIVNTAVKQYTYIISLRGILDANTSKIMSLCAKVNDYQHRMDTIVTDAEALKIQIENAEKTNAELYVKINEKDATINKLEIAVYSMAIIICVLIVYIIC